MTERTAEQQERFVAPRVNIIDNIDDVLIEAELPGVTKEELEIEVNNGELVVTGRRRAFDGQSGTRHVAERPQANYRRVFTLTKAIDPEKIDAALENGLLKLRLQKAESVKPRKIEIG
jgi:HSP20 family protein